jgi:hypothetical protein
MRLCILVVYTTPHYTTLYKQYMHASVYSGGLHYTALHHTIQTVHVYLGVAYFGGLLDKLVTCDTDCVGDAEACDVGLRELGGVVQWVCMVECVYMSVRYV